MGVSILLLQWVETLTQSILTCSLRAGLTQWTRARLLIFSLNPSSRQAWKSWLFGPEFISITLNSRQWVTLYLGVQFDQHLSMAPHVASTIQFFANHETIRNIGRIRPYLTTEACKTSIHNLVTSRIDYCSTVLTWIPKQQIHRL